ncbi:MAG TPA: DUF3352 domain-containing protein [Verrucomicrobiae bacterium]|nr:DUF3352 domain-containing protein [Verrucomicrobiae bacterium]
MKRNFALLLSVVVVAAGFLVVNGCKREATPNAQVESTSLKSAETNSFKEVTSKLDAGGDLYVYLSTEQWLKNLSDTLGKWRDAVASAPGLGENQPALTNGFDAVTRLVKESGLEDISGVGMSSIAREPGIYYSKLIVHHYRGEGNGFIWTMFGKQPHELDGLDLLPADTALAVFHDLDVGELASVVQKECEESGVPQAAEFVKNFPAEFEKGTGMKWDDVLNSLGGEYGIVMTLDPAKTMSLPLPTQVPLEIPEPAVMLVVKVKDDAIFNRIDQQLTKKQQMPVIKTDKNGLKMRTMPLPFLNLRPTIAQSEGYLFLATSDTIVQEALAVKGGKAGLKSSDEFKKLTAGVPQQGNQFCFLSKRFGETMMTLQLNAMENNNGTPPQLKELMQSLIQPEKAGFVFMVGGNTDEGWQFVGNGNQSGGKVLAAATVVPAAVIAGVALPAVAKARAAAEKKAAHTQSAQ